MPQNPTAVDLIGLEGRIQQATELISKLKTERDELRRERNDLEKRLKQLETSSRSVPDYRKRAQEAEARLAEASQERITLARRVEQMLEKLRAVEEDRLGVS